MELSLTLFKHLKMLIILIFTSVVFLGLALYFYDDFSNKTLVYLLILFFVLFMLPVLYLHYNYYENSKGVTYEIEKSGLIIKKNNIKREIKIDSINEIVFFMTANRLQKSGYSQFAFENYHYAKIILKDDEQIIITCLFSDKIEAILESNFKAIKITKIKTFYPVI
ncbi:hypothetical protein [Flavobacterium sp. UBA4197]|uniref:hypothetical protein n=1 Tax=Flavobacterium sp. UBA4197 TaxID=1946546 RepID=UPI00257D9145|nr:hypothetical protein [Flavobacterium sp. UBA4197]